MDVTEAVEGDWDAALALAKSLQSAIFEALGLTASFGIGPTRVLAKMSSEVNKPNGIHRVLPDEIEAFFYGRSVREIPGIGPKRATQLAEWGYTTADELHALGELWQSVNDANTRHRRQRRSKLAAPLRIERMLLTRTTVHPQQNARLAARPVDCSARD